MNYQIKKTPPDTKSDYIDRKRRGSEAPVRKRGSKAERANLTELPTHMGLVFGLFFRPTILGGMQFRTFPHDDLISSMNWRPYGLSHIPNG